MNREVHARIWERPGVRFLRATRPALRHVATEPPIYRRHPRQAARGSGWAEEGRRHRGAQRLGPAALVEAAGVAVSRPVPLAAHWHGGLTYGGSGFSSHPPIHWLEVTDRPVCRSKMVPTRLSRINLAAENTATRRTFCGSSTGGAARPIAPRATVHPKRCPDGAVRHRYGRTHRAACRS